MHRLALDLVIADSTKARERLGWEPKHSDIGTMIRQTWEYQIAHDFIHASG